MILVDLSLRGKLALIEVRRELVLGSRFSEKDHFFSNQLSLKPTPTLGSEEGTFLHSTLLKVSQLVNEHAGG